MAWLAILIAAGIGYAVTVGLRGHMEKEPKGTPWGPPGTAAREAECLAAFDKLPTGKSPEDNVREAAKIAYLYATPGTADEVEILANHCTAIGHPKAGECLREKANSLRLASPPDEMVPIFPTVDTPPEMVPIFPTVDTAKV